MKFSVKWRFLAAFIALFAVLAAFVFWGTWSPDVAPVMPDDAWTHPLAFSDQFRGWFHGWLRNGIFTPVNVFGEGILVSKYWTQELKYALNLFLASLGLAFFLRGRGLSPLASYGAGLLLGFCGYWMTLFSAGHFGWFVIMGPMVFAFAFADRVATAGKIRDGILLGACVGWGTCHQPDLFFLFAVFVAVYGLYACLRARTFPWKAGLAAFVFFAVVGAPGIRGAFKDALAGRDKQIEESKGSALAGGKGAVGANASDAEKKKADDEARWVFVTNWSLPPEESLEFFIPRLNGDTSCPMTLQLGRATGKDVKPYTGRLGRPLGATRGAYRQHSLYVGWVTCLLALCALAWGAGGLVGAFRRNAPSEETHETVISRISAKCAHGRYDIVFFFAAALVFWLFALGRNCEPMYRLVYRLPFGDYLRGPVKWHHLTEFSLCVLAGFGIDALLGFLQAKGLRFRTAFALVAALVVFGAADLARVDKLYCAPIDLTVVRARNAAADEILRRGKGTVCDLLEGGNGLLSRSFGAHGASVTRELNAKGVRFVWTSLELMKRNPQLAGWLKQNATVAGLYLVTARGISGAAPDRANAALYQMNGVPPPPAPKPPQVDFGILSLGILSLLGTLAAFGCLFVPRRGL